MFGVSHRTLYRCLDKYGIDTNTYTNISESEIDKLLKQIKGEHLGEVLLQGHLVHMNVKVPRAILCSAIHRINHANTVCRRSDVIHRRVYSSPHPNAVWHIDRNRKMIRWRLVIHAGVDGFSRVVVYIKCANNNCAPTFLTCLCHFWEDVSYPYQ